MASLHKLAPVIQIVTTPAELRKLADTMERAQRETVLGGSITVERWVSQEVDIEWQWDQDKPLPPLPDAGRYIAATEMVKGHQICNNGVWQTITNLWVDPAMNQVVIHISGGGVFRFDVLSQVKVR